MRRQKARTVTNQLWDASPSTATFNLWPFSNTTKVCSPFSGAWKFELCDGEFIWDDFRDGYKTEPCTMRWWRWWCGHSMLHPLTATTETCSIQLLPCVPAFKKPGVFKSPTCQVSLSFLKAQLMFRWKIWWLILVCFYLLSSTYNIQSHRFTFRKPNCNKISHY